MRAALFYHAVQRRGQPRARYRLDVRAAGWMHWILGAAALGAALAGGCWLAGGPGSGEEGPAPQAIEYVSPVGHVRARIAGARGARRVVFVHGTPGSASAWNRYLREPPPGWELYAIDRPGFGGSGSPGPMPALADQAAALAPLLQRAAGGWPVLVGHSLGGAVVLRAAADHTDRVGGVVVLAGALDPELEQLHWYNHLARPFEPVLPRALRNANRELRAFRVELERLRERLARVRCPVIVIHGERDGLVPYANVDYLRAQLRGTASLEIVPIPDGGHFIPWQHADLVRAALEKLR